VGMRGPKRSLIRESVVLRLVTIDPRTSVSRENV
jgi:hypothetical protein